MATTAADINEHILGDRWPPYDMREEMLEEAVEVIRMLWQGDRQSPLTAAFFPERSEGKNHQIGPDQEGFFRFYERNVLSKLR